MMAKYCKYAVNPESGEVYQRTADKDWRDAVLRWREAMNTVRQRSQYQFPVVHCPLPQGHLNFRGGKNNPAATDVAPVPVWSDGVGCLYAGQRVGWESSLDRSWFSGHIVRVDEDSPDCLIVRLWHGGVCSIPIASV